jgi:hypothetical protein
MELLRARLVGKWEVLHVDGHAEKCKKRADWTFEERGNVASDAIAKRCMKMAAADGKDDAAALEEWNRQVAAQSWKQIVRKPALQQSVRLVETAKLSSVVQWQIRWGAQGPVVGPVGKWIREAISNMYTSEYMMEQPAALYAQPKAEGGHCLAHDTRLIRDVWMRSGQVKERGMATKVYVGTMCV